MTRDTVNVLSIPCTGNTARKLLGNILNILMMDQVGFSQVHCPCPCSVFTMSWVRKLVFVPSEPGFAGNTPSPGSLSPRTPERERSTTAVLPFGAGCSPDRRRAGIGRQAEELVPSQEPAPHSPPLTWECDRTPGTRPPHTLDPLPDHVGNYVPHI